MNSRQGKLNSSSRLRLLTEKPARVREQFEERLADLRKQRIPLEERLRMIDALIKSEGGE
jgi:hypothetical protein